MELCEKKTDLEKEYDEKCNEIIKNISADIKRVYALIPELEKKTAYEEHCEIDGKSLYRGYYHPNPLSYFTVGYWTRGKFTKKISPEDFKRRNENFVYKYDENGCRTLIYEMYGAKMKTVEVLIKDGNITHGYTYKGSVLYAYTKQIYRDELPVLIERIILQPFGHKRKRHMYEEYSFEYGKDGIISAVNTVVNKYEDEHITVSRCVYGFEHDADGYISSYKTKYPIEEFEGEEYREFQPLKKVKF